MRKHGDAKKYNAHVIHVGHECDIAMVTKAVLLVVTVITFCIVVVVVVVVVIIIIIIIIIGGTRGAHNPNLQVVIIMHASYLCSQHSFGLPLRINGMHRTQFEPSISRNVITLVLTICHLKLTQSTALEQKRFAFDRCRLHSVTFGYY